MRHLRWEWLVTVLVLATGGAAIGQEGGPDVDDVLGIVDDKLVGVWEATDEGIIIRVHLRPDGIGIWNGDFYGDGSMYVWVGRYGASNGHLAQGRATNFFFEKSGEWVDEGIDEEREASVQYEIADATLTIHDPEGGTTVWTKSNEEMLIPDKVTLFDGYTSVQTHSWGWIKVGLAR